MQRFHVSWHSSDLHYILTDEFACVYVFIIWYKRLHTTVAWAVCLSSVCNVVAVADRQRLELFSNIFAQPIIAQGLGQFVLFLDKNSKGF